MDNNIYNSKIIGGKIVLKKVFFLLVILIATSSTLLVFSLGNESLKQEKSVYTSFKVYHPYHFQFDKVINKIVEYSEIEKWSKYIIVPELDKVTNKIIRAHTDNGVEVNINNLDILFDKTYLSQYIKEKLRSNYDNYWIVSMPSFIEGYTVIIEHNGMLSYMPVLSGYEVYGGFVDKKIYSSDEYTQLCAPKDCTFIINGKTIESDQLPIMQYGRVKFPLRSLLEHLGFNVDWNAETESVIFMSEKNSYIYSTNKKNNPTGNILKNGELKAGGLCTIENGRTMVDNLFVQFLCKEFNLSITGDTDKHIITVRKK